MQSHLTEAGISYSIKQLLIIAGVSQSNKDGKDELFSPVEIKYQRELDLDNANPNTIYIKQADSKSLRDVFESSSKNFSWISTKKILPPQADLSISRNIPIILDSVKFNQLPVEILNNHAILLNFDIIAVTFFMLTRFEEFVSSDFDQFRRFPASESIAFKKGFLMQPIVDEYAMILRSWMQYLDPSWEPIKRKHKILLTHDVDFVRTLPNFRKIVRKVIQLSKKLGVLEGIRKTSSIYKSEKRDLSQSEYIQNINKLAKYSEDNSINSLFFFKTSNVTFFDSGYKINHHVMNSLLRDLSEKGFLIGLHGGFYTYKNSKKMKEEKNKLEKVMGNEVVHCRQHYLRFDAKRTWQEQQIAGFSYDYTLGYAQHEGFRCGTCHPYHPFDIKLQKEMAIVEVPLIVMDTTLFGYRKYTPDQANSIILDLARKCHSVEGTFTLLWHNTSLSGNYEIWGKMYKEILQKLAELFNM